LLRILPGLDGIDEGGPAGRIGREPRPEELSHLPENAHEVVHAAAAGRVRDHQQQR